MLATGAGIGAAVFYAGRDEKIRDELEKVPFAQQVLLSIYGEKKKTDVDSEDPMLPLAKTDLDRKGDEESLLRPFPTVCVAMAIKKCFYLLYVYVTFGYMFAFQNIEVTTCSDSEAIVVMSQSHGRFFSYL